MCEWGAIRDERAVEAAEGGGRELCATGVDVVVVVAFIVFQRVQRRRARKGTLDYVSTSCLEPNEELPSDSTT